MFAVQSLSIPAFVFLCVILIAAGLWFLPVGQTVDEALFLFSGQASALLKFPGSQPLLSRVLFFGPSKKYPLQDSNKADKCKDTKESKKNIGKYSR